MRIQFFSGRRWWLVTLALACFASATLHASPSPTAERIYVDAGLLSRRDIAGFNQMLSQIYAESGVDVRILYTRQVPSNDLESFARGRMRSLWVGQEVDRRGLLFVYDEGTRRLRIEVGPKLEGIITDGFAGYLMREHAAAFFAMGDKTIGMRTTLFMVQRRIREATLGKALDPRVMSFITDSVRLAAGAGATTRVATADASASMFIGRPSTAAERARYAPQPTVKEAFARYLDLLREGNNPAGLSLFTQESQEYLKKLPLTRAYNDYVLYGEYGQGFIIDERGSRAMLVFTTTPFVSPHFFRRTASGWQLDIAAEVLDTREYAGGPYSWGIYDDGDEFSYVFADRWVMLKGALRVSGGDNRALPTHSWK